MPSLPKEISDFMARYRVLADELWEVRNGAYAIKHKALERVAAENGIRFEPPVVIEASAADKIAVVCVTGYNTKETPSLPEWSIGEASPANNKNPYCFAMAEKRAKDRVILKLLRVHGAIYSDAEADELTANGNGTLPKKDARDIYTKLQAEIRSATSREQLKLWLDGNKDRVDVLPEDWKDILRLQYQEMLADLRQREAA